MEEKFTNKKMKCARNKVLINTFQEIIGMNFVSVCCYTSNMFLLIFDWEPAQFILYSYTY